MDRKTDFGSLYRRMIEGEELPGEASALQLTEIMQRVAGERPAASGPEQETDEKEKEACTQRN